MTRFLFRLMWVGLAFVGGMAAMKFHEEGTRAHNEDVAVRNYVNGIMCMQTMQDQFECDVYCKRNVDCEAGARVGWRTQYTAAR